MSDLNFGQLLQGALGDDLQVGDIIQCEGANVPFDVQGKYFIVRALAPDLQLSWPYQDAGCTVLYVPRKDTQLERDWLTDCQAIERREKAANKKMGLVLKARPLGVY